MSSPHDYRRLITRWRKVARKSGVPLRRLVTAGAHPLFYFQTPALQSAGGIYISAGLHGDEPAGAEALIVWAERHAHRLARLPLLLFPALNPWGLIHNTRADAGGLDLNRLFHRDDHPVISAVKRVATPHQFALALMLHEDFDAEGFYIYEVKRDRPFWGESLLDIARPFMSIDPRARIDGRTARAGLIRRRFQRSLFLKMGYPEAIWLHEFHARRSLTIETPSEFALEERVRVHGAVIEECVRRTYGGDAALQLPMRPGCLASAR